MSASQGDPFRALERVLRRGFLLHTTQVGPHRIVLKHVIGREIETLPLYLPPEIPLKDKQLYLKSVLVALGTFSVNGVFFLPQRETHLSTWVRTISKWPARVVQELYLETLRLTNLYASQVLLVGKHVDTPAGRSLWAICPKDQGLMGDSWTGWVGSERVGEGPVQEVWRMYQGLVDTLDRQDEISQGLMWVVGCVSKEGVKSLQESIQARQERRKELGEMGRSGKGGLIRKKTSEEVVEELHASLRGEYDDHDHQVVQTEAALLEEYLKRERAEEARMRAYAEQGQMLQAHSSLDRGEVVEASAVLPGMMRGRRHI